MARMGSILATTVDVIRRAAIASLAFVPGSATRILDMLAVPEDRRALADAVAGDALTAGTMLPPPEPVFRKFEQAKPDAA
jgi:methionyl-tRNA synthetase